MADEVSLEDLRSAVDRLRDELAQAEERYNVAQVAAFTERTGVAVGSKIRCGNTVYQVSRIVVQSWCVEIFGRPKTKHGWHKREHWIGFFEDNERIEVCE